MDDDLDPRDQRGPRTKHNICQDCMLIDFSPAFAIPVPSLDELRDYTISSGLVVAELRHFSMDCELCEEFRSVRYHGDDDDGYEDGDVLYDLRVFPFNPLFYSECIVTGRYPTIVFPNRLLWLQPVPHDEAIHLTKDLGHLVSRTNVRGWTACVITDDGPDLFRPRRVSERFDATHVKAWLMACNKHHGTSCSTPTIVSSLILIDCETRELCQPAEQPPYVALSYVWGSIMAREQKDRESGDPDRHVKLHLPPDDTLSQVIRDSISVTKELGFQYLWVDKFCIEQIDGTRKDDQINNMDKVYRSAALTIIAAAGEDEQYGLPGIGTERNAPRTLIVNASTIMHMSPEFRYMWLDVKWSNRAWTLQEEIFSRRRLYFFSEKVSFLCKEMFCCEAYGGAELDQYEGNMKAYSNAWFNWGLQKDLMFEDGDVSDARGFPSSCGITGARGKGRLAHMWTLIWNYTRRSMTYPSDALRAFAGIRRVFESRETPVCMIQGVPAVLTVSSDNAPFLAKFVSSLCWHTVEAWKSSRKPHFPSWTWLGWSGGVFFVPGLDDDHAFEVDPRSITVIYDDDHQIALQEVARSLAKKQSGTLSNQHDHRLSQRLPFAVKDITSPVALQFRAPTLTANLLSHNWPAEWNSATLAGMIVDKGEAYELPFSPLFLLNGIVGRNLGCALLRVDQDGDIPRAHWLILQWQGSIDAVRIGKITTLWLGDDTFEIDDLLGQLDWREIRLM